MKRIFEIKPVFVDNIPDKLEYGILYISRTCKTATHLCACGCGLETVTPLSPPENWILINNNSLVSLSPSIGNTKGEAPNYHAHYYIIDNKIIWCK